MTILRSLYHLPICARFTFHAPDDSYFISFANVGWKDATNNAGGINGGITNGNVLVFRLTVKPTSSIGLAQQTVNLQSGQMETLEVRGRHDACIALRVPVVAEAITALALADLRLMIA